MSIPQTGRGGRAGPDLSEGMTILMVTHNPKCARYARRILRLSDGLVVEEEEMQKADGGYGARGDQKKVPFPEPTTCRI